MKINKLVKVLGKKDCTTCHWFRMSHSPMTNLCHKSKGNIRSSCGGWVGKGFPQPPKPNFVCKNHRIKASNMVMYPNTFEMIRRLRVNEKLYR